MEQLTAEEASIQLTRYHMPTDEQKIRMQELRDAAAVLIFKIVAHCPQNADRNAAIRKAREALMTANASIVLPPVTL